MSSQMRASRSSTRTLLPPICPTPPWKVRFVIGPSYSALSTSCVTITSRTAFMERKLRMSRPWGSVLKSRASTDSAGATSKDWIRPVFLASRRRDVGAKPSELLSNEYLQLMTSLSYTIRGVFAGHLPRRDLGPDRHRTELFSRSRHLRRGGVQPRDERLLGRESGHAARSTEAARGDGPPGGLSAPDGGSQAELGVPREREGVPASPRGNRERRRRVCRPRRVPQPHGGRRGRQPLADGPGLRRRRTPPNLPRSAGKPRQVARGRHGAQEAGLVELARGGLGHAPVP